MTERNGITRSSDFFRLLEIDVTDAGRNKNAFDRLRKKHVNGILVRNVYSLDFLNNLQHRLEAHDPPFLQTWFPEEFNAWFYGRNLNLADPDLHGYFEEARSFQEHLNLLFPHSLGISTYLAKLMSVLDNNRPFQAPPGPEPGQYYMFATIRCHLEGGYIPPHIDYEYVRRRSYEHLRNLIDTEIFSYVLPLSAPDGGGTLNIYNYQVDLPLLQGKEHVSQDHTYENLESVSIPCSPGSLFIFDSGRYLHGVTPVIGQQKRWTICSFMALNKNRDAMYCWG